MTRPRRARRSQLQQSSRASTRASALAITSLVLTPPPTPLSALRTPTVFLVTERGITPDYERDLFARLPEGLPKKLVNVDGSVFWMVSHPREAARVVAEWFGDTLPRKHAR